MKSLLIAATFALAAKAQDDPDTSGVLTAISDAVADVTDVGTFTQSVSDNDSVLGPLVDDTDGYAVFAPNDAAFTALPSIPDDLSPVLSYHIVSDTVDFSQSPAVVETTLESDQLDTNQVVIVGDNNTLSYGVGSVTVVGDPIEFDGNQVYVIDGVLIPPADPATVLTDPNAADSGAELANALTVAELVDTVTDASNITVFAPVDDAWADVDVTTIDQTELQNLLQYHVVPQVVYSPNIGDGGEYETLNGKTLTVSVDGDTVTVNSATVVATDYLTNNGVIHYIDAILDVNDGQDPDGDEVKPGTNTPVGAAPSLKAAGMVGTVMAGLALLL